MEQAMIGPWLLGMMMGAAMMGLLWTGMCYADRPKKPDPSKCRCGNDAGHRGPCQPD